MTRKYEFLKNCLKSILNKKQSQTLEDEIDTQKSTVKDEPHYYVGFSDLKVENINTKLK